MKRVRACFATLLLAVPFLASAQEPPTIRIGHGLSAEEQLWLMAARPDLTPNQNKKYRLKFLQFQGPTDRFQAFLAGEIDGGTSPGMNILFARNQGLDIKIVANLCMEAAGPQYFRTTFLVKENGPVRTVADLKGGTVAVLGPKSAMDMWARAALLKAGLVPDRDVKFVPMPSPAVGPAVRSDRVTTGHFVQPFYGPEVAKGGLRPLFTSVDAMGFDHDLLDIFLSSKFLSANGEAVRAFLSDYVAATKYYLANKEQARADLVKANFVRAPLEVYVKAADWKRDANGRVDIGSLKKLAAFMHEKLNWLDKPANVDELVDLSYLPRQEKL